MIRQNPICKDMNTTLLNPVKTRSRSIPDLLSRNNFEKVCYFESDGDLTYIVLDDGSRVRLDTFLHDLEKVLPSQTFFRCGWSFVINLNKVREYWILDYPFVVMSNGEVVPVPHTDVERIRKRLNEKVAVRKK